MKQKIFILLLILEIWALHLRAQVQNGQTCLFTCAHYICKDKSILQYESDFRAITRTYEDYEMDGARATVKQFLDFIKTEFETADIPVVVALQKHYFVITTMNPDRFAVIRYAHSVVLEQWYSGESGGTIMYYDPLSGRHLFINYIEYVQSLPLYAIAVKK